MAVNAIGFQTLVPDTSIIRQSPKLPQQVQSHVQSVPQNGLEILGVYAKPQVLAPEERAINHTSAAKDFALTAQNFGNRVKEYAEGIKRLVDLTATIETVAFTCTLNEPDKSEDGIIITNLGNNRYSMVSPDKNMTAFFDMSSGKPRLNRIVSKEEGNDVSFTFESFEDGRLELLNYSVMTPNGGIEIRYNANTGDVEDFQSVSARNENISKVSKWVVFNEQGKLTKYAEGVIFEDKPDGTRNFSAERESKFEGVGVDTKPEDNVFDYMEGVFETYGKYVKGSSVNKRVIVKDGEGLEYIEGFKNLTKRQMSDEGSVDVVDVFHNGLILEFEEGKWQKSKLHV